MHTCWLVIAELSLILTEIFLFYIFVFKRKHATGLRTSVPVLSFSNSAPKICRDLTRLCYLVSQTKHPNRWKIVLKLLWWPVCDQFDLGLKPYSDMEIIQHCPTKWVKTKNNCLKLFPDKCLIIHAFSEGNATLVKSLAPPWIFVDTWLNCL